MRRSRVTITLKPQILTNLDRLIDGEQIRNRSHAIEFILDRHFQPEIKKAVIMAGGKKTPISKSVLERLILNLKKSNIKEIIICTGINDKKIKDYFGDIKVFQEKTPLQTGGAIRQIKNSLGHEPFIVVYGDVETGLPFSDIINFHKEYKALATIALTTVNRPENFGQLELHGITLVNFYQKNNAHAVKSNLINCGIYIFQPEIFDYLPKDNKPFLLENVIEELIRQKKVNGFVFEQKWLDVDKKD